jgi:hypothetical protein
MQDDSWFIQNHAIYIVNLCFGVILLILSLAAVAACGHRMLKAKRSGKRWYECSAAHVIAAGNTACKHWCCCICSASSQECGAFRRSRRRSFVSVATFVQLVIQVLANLPCAMCRPCSATSCSAKAPDHSNIFLSSLHSAVLQTVSLLFFVVPNAYILSHGTAYNATVVCFLPAAM